MSQEKQKKKIEECGKKTEITRLEIQLLKDEKNIELNDIHGITKTENDEESLIPDIIENFQQEIISDNFDDKPKPLLNLEGIEKCLSEVKEKKEEDLDIYIEDVISILEEFSCILNFEELIDDPNYTFKLFMNSLKRVINFNYFHQKFIVPNVKTKENNGQTYNEKKGIKNGKNMSGDDSRNGNIVILDGKIVADGAPGIGGGSRESSAGGITIKGGSVTAKSVGDYAAAPAIGGGSLSDNNVITISGGNVTATGGYFAAGIGCGLPSSYYGYGTTCASVTISGGTVVSEGGIRAWAAIGGDRGGVVISGGDVTAIGTYQVAGIGSMDSVVISGGVVTAVGGRDAPGIGAAGETASEYRTFGDIIISGGEVKSTGGMYSSGLGAGVYSHGGNIIITPDVVKVYVDVEKADDSPYSVGTASYGSTLGKLIIDGEEWDYRTEKPFIYYGRGYKDTVNADSGRVSIGHDNSLVRLPGEKIIGVTLKKSYNAMGRVVDSDHKARGAYYQKKCLAR